MSKTNTSKSKLIAVSLILLLSKISFAEDIKGTLSEAPQERATASAVVAPTESASSSDLSLEDILNLKVSIASKTKESLLTTPGTVYVYTEEDIKKYGWMSLREVLAAVPNMELMWTWNWLAGGQRGFSSPGNFSNTVLMIDGREVSSNTSNEAAIRSYFTTHKIARIEILQGPNSTLYGNAAMQGVINIITKYNIDGKDGTSVQYIGGAVGTQQLAMNYRKSGENSIIGFSGTYFHSEQNYRELADFAASPERYSRHIPGQWGNVDSEIYRYKGYDNFHIPETSYAFDFYTKYKDYYIGTNYFRSENGAGLELVQPFYQSLNSRQSQLYYAGWKHEFEKTTSLQVEFQYFNQNNSDTGQYVTPNGDNPPTGYKPPGDSTIADHFGDFFIYNQRTSDPNNSTRIRSIFNNESDSWGHFIAGYDFTQLNIKTFWQWHATWADMDNYDKTSNVDYHRDHSIFAEDTLKLGEKYFLTFGARYLTTNYLPSQLLPRASLIYQPTSNSSIKLTVADSYRGPSAWETSGVTNKNDLKPVKMNMTELNYSQQASVADMSMFNTAAIYLMQQPFRYVNKNRPDGSNILDIDKKQFSVSGFEDEIKLSRGSTSGFLGLRWVKPDKTSLTNHSDIEDILNVPISKIKLGMSFKFGSNYDTSLFIDHWAKTLTDGPTLDSSSDMLYEIPAWTNVNFKLGINDVKMDTMKGRFELYVENLLNTPYYEANLRGLGTAPLQFLQAPRNARLQLTFDM